MRRTLWAAATVAVLAGVTPAMADHVGNVPWVEPEQGFAQARRTGKPILIVFSASW